MRCRAAAHDVGDVDRLALRTQRTGLQPGHVEQVVDEARQPLGLLLGGREQLVARGLAVGGAVAAQGRDRRPGSRPGASCRSWPMEVSRAVRRRSVSASSLVASTSRASWTRSIGKGGLVEQRVEQAALGRGQQRPGQILLDAGHAELAAAGAQRAGTGGVRPADCPSRGRRACRCASTIRPRRGRWRRAGPRAGRRPARRGCRPRAAGTRPRP